MKTLIVINCGHAALDNGAIAPLTKMYDIAKVADADVIPGEYYGDDRIEVYDKNLPIVLELLEESCLLYRLPEDGFHWRGIKPNGEFDIRLKQIQAFKDKAK